MTALISLLRRLRVSWGGLQRRTQALLLLWALFVVLVACGVHGSSIGANYQTLMPRETRTYTLEPLAELLHIDTEQYADALMMKDRGIRSDEWLVSTPWALAQFSHKPRFPVINTNIGAGQNMLLLQPVPVWHIATLARPATWGYFFLGPWRGLAFYWWFQPFACFTALYLLLELVLENRRILAASAALWFVSSAYAMMWSDVPNYFTFFPALACLAGYRLLTAPTRRWALFWGALLGLAVPGFVMALYPPWQVSLGILFLTVFAGLFFRDRLYSYLRRPSRELLMGGGVALFFCAALLGSFFVSCLPAIRIVNHTVYPGRRVSTGGEWTYAELFKGGYNLITNYEAPKQLYNQSEAASFYHLFPIVLVGLLVLPRLRKRFDVVGWLLVAHTLVILFYMLVGIPELVAKLTFLSYVPATRADLGLGLGSMFLVAYAFARMDGEPRAEPSRKQAWAWSLGAFAILLLFYHHGLAFNVMVAQLIPSSDVILLSILLATLAYLFFAGRALVFSGVVLVLQLATSFPFNPLSGRFDAIYESPLSREIRRLNGLSEKPPLWLCYGPPQVGVLVSMLGGRSLAGMHFTPELDLWRTFDPEGAHLNVYNRYARLGLLPSNDPTTVRFQAPGEGQVRVRISPHNPQVRAMGARYVLAAPRTFSGKGDSAVKRIYKSEDGRYAIFELL